MKNQKKWSSIVSFLGLISVALLLILLLRDQEVTPGGMLESPLPTPTQRIATATVVEAKLTPKPTKTPYPTTTPTKAKPSATPASGEWLTYHDEKAGYSIDYPADAHVSDKGGYIHDPYHITDINFHMEGAAGYQGIAIQIQDIEEETPIEEIVNALHADVSLGRQASMEVLDSITDFTVKEYEAYKAIIPALNTEFTILILAHEKLYVLAPVHGPVKTHSDPRTVELFYKMLETLKVDADLEKG